MNVSVPIPGHSYDIVIERGGLNQVGDWLRTLSHIQIGDILLSKLSIQTL